MIRSFIVFFVFPLACIIIHSHTLLSTGMKAYKSIHDETDLRLFRPELNTKRLKDSMARLAMPGYDFDAQELIHCIGKLVRLGELLRVAQHRNR